MSGPLGGFATALDPAMIDECGFQVLRLLSATQIERAIDDLEMLGVATDDGSVGRFPSMASTDGRYRAAAADLTRSVMRSAGVTSDVRDESTVIAWPGPSGGAGLHVGSLPVNVEEAADAVAAERRVVVDVAIDGCGVGAGQVWVVPGSHLWPHEVVEQMWHDAAEDVARRCAVPVVLAAGDALTSDPRLLRFSLPNHGRPTRTVTCSIDRWDVRRLVGAPTSPGPASAVDEDVIERAAARVVGGHRPEEPPLDRISRCWSCGEELPGFRVRSRWVGYSVRRCEVCPTTRRAPGPSRRSAPLGGAVTLPFGPVVISKEPVLRDPALSDALERDGFVVLPRPLISRAQASALADRFGQLHGWAGTGHLNDFNHTGLRYRMDASAAMDDALAGPLSEQFVDHDAFLRTFLCKWPGDEGELEPHQDWSYVDERGGTRAHLAFVALTDIHESNGQVRILRGSHLFDSTPRGTGMRAAWLAHLDLIVPRMEPLNLRAGQCVIWDSATVHASLPNSTDEPRLAAGMWMAPRSTQLVHFRRCGPDRVTCFQIDSEFYRTQTPFRLMVADPADPVGELVAVDDRLVDRSELSVRLDWAARGTAEDRRGHSIIRRVTASLMGRRR